MSFLAAINEKARGRQLRLLLAGGHAVIAHGFPRNTFDLDLVIRRDDRERWIEGLIELGYEVLHEGPGFLQMTSAAQSVPVDLMVVNGPTFERLWAEGQAAAFLPSDAKVVSLRHLLALKCHAIKHGHPGRVVKDAEDLIHLIQVNQLDITRSEWRELILKYGTQELYEKLERTTKA